jgi:hypothetical protein
VEEEEKVEALVEGMKKSKEKSKEKARKLKEYVDSETGEKFDTETGLNLYRKYVKD